MWVVVMLNAWCKEFVHLFNMMYVHTTSYSVLEKDVNPKKNTDQKVPEVRQISSPNVLSY